MAHDRRLAIAHGTTRFEPARPGWLPKTDFFKLMRNRKLAQLGTGFDPDSGFVTIAHEGQEVLRGEITEPAGRAPGGGPGGLRAWPPGRHFSARKRPRAVL